MTGSVAVSPKGSSVLGVSSSIKGHSWFYRLANDRRALVLSQQVGVPEVIGRVLAARDVQLEDAATYLNPRLRDLMPDPSVMKDMDLAARRIAKAISCDEKVAVFGDYDVDGATSSALLVRFFRSIGVSLDVYIPDRIKEGYGPNIPALMKLYNGGVQLVITVDCGIAAHDAIAHATEAGLEIIVVDHHLGGPQLPKALAIINPNRLDENTAQLSNLAAVGVSFLLVVAINRQLRNAGWFKTRPEPDIRIWLDLVALGTVCDVVPLTGINRALVIQGLKVMCRRLNPGIAALADSGKVQEPLNSFHLGFIVGPRVNAGGRVGQADLGVRLLGTDDIGEAKKLAAELEHYNTERRKIESEVLAAAICSIESNGRQRDEMIVVAGMDWHPGVIGIVASRLVERYGRPTFVLAITGEIAKGSGRSVHGFDLGTQVMAANQERLLLSGGGHPMAAGLTVSVNMIDSLRGFLLKRARQMEFHKRTPSLAVDAVVSVDGATRDLAGLLESAGPYGSGNPSPRLVLRNARIAKVDVVGGDHVRCILAGKSGKRLKAMAFRSTQEELGRVLMSGQDQHFHIAGQLRTDNWNGRADVQFSIDDLARVSAGEVVYMAD